MLAVIDCAGVAYCRTHAKVLQPNKSRQIGRWELSHLKQGHLKQGRLKLGRRENVRKDFRYGFGLVLRKHADLADSPVRLLTVDD